MTVNETLLEQAKAYDPGALSELYDSYAPQIYAYIYRRVGDAGTAEDLTGDVFVRVLRAIQNDRVWQESFQGWLYRIAHNLVVDHYRRQPSAPDLELDETTLSAVEEDPAKDIDQALARQQIRQALHLLTPEQQQVLALRFGEGLTTKETATIVRKTVGAVEALQRRAIAALQRILTDRGTP